ncbi:MAG: FG-GAP repeat protein [Planctomycetota bacterium]
MHQKSARTLSRFALLSITLSAAAAAQDCPTKLLAADAAASDEAGYAVALAGSTALIGARYETQLGSSAGAAYAWRLDPITGWTQTQKLTGSSVEAFDEFGQSVAATQDTLVVGARNDDDNGADAGAAYVFRVDPMTGTWAEEVKVLAPDGEPGDRFGSALGIDGDVIVVGAQGDDDQGSAAGAVYVHRYDAMSGLWAMEQKLYASDAQVSDKFGASVAISGDVIVVGAFDEDQRASGAGAAYVFRYDPVLMTWAEEQKLLASDGASNDQFGWSVKVDGEVLVATARYADDLGLDAGAAYVFRRDALLGAWQEEAKLLAASGASGDAFGESADIEGDLVVVGGNFHDLVAADTGGAWAFRFDGAVWREVAAIRAADADFDDRFGGSVAVSSGRALIGAQRDSQAALRAGAAYVYDMTAADRNGNGVPDACEAAGTAFCTASPNSTGAPSSIAAIGSAALIDDNVTLYVSGLPQTVLGYFVVSRDMLQIPGAGGAQGTLCVASTAMGRYAGNVLSSGSLGLVSMPVDLTSIPTPTGSVAAAVGDTWNFQLWHRDTTGSGSTSNFSDAVSVTFE